jgi:hypothetical protein
MPDTGRLRDDVVEFLSSMLRNRTADVEAYEALSAALAGDPELAKQCRSTLVAKFSSSFRALVARAVERGELPEGTDIELVADIAPALVRYRRQTTGRHLDEAFINRVADQFFTVPKQ